jgi:hypothetical protein
VTEFITAGAGFLAAVLWFDLMFDVQVARGVTTEALESIAGYYRRVTTTASPMNRLVALVMLATLAATTAQLLGDAAPDWAAGASLLLAASGIGLAGARTVPNAVRLGAGEGDAPALTRAVLRDHVFCLAAMTGVLVLQLAFCR